MANFQHHLRIGELSRRAGISPELLRAWERRYGLLRPIRTPGGFRLYSSDDEQRIRRMQTHLADGLSAAEAARLAADAAEPTAQTPRAGHVPDATVLAEALDRVDEAAAQQEFDRLLGAYTLETLVAGVLLPYLHTLGERWERGEVSVGQEHFASNLLRGRLLGLARGWDLGRGPRALLACAPGELHDLPLIAFGLLLRARGMRIAFLGPDTPVDTLAGMAERLEPDVVVVSATMPGLLEPHAAALAALAGGHRLAVGGAGATVELAAAAGAELLDDNPVVAAATTA